MQYIEPFNPWQDAFLILTKYFFMSGEVVKSERRHNRNENVRIDSSLEVVLGNQVPVPVFLSKLLTQSLIIQHR